MSKILLVDDEEDIQETNKYTLEEIGYQCITASNGMEGLTKALSEKPDLVLLDMMMPVMTGIDVLKSIREKHSVKSMPVIMLTAVSDLNHVKTILSLGVNDYVVKPFDSDVLVEKVKGIIGAPKKPMSREEKDVTTINLNWEVGNVSHSIANAFNRISKMGWAGKTKFILNIGDLNELTPADLRIIGDGIGATTEERITLKFVISSEKIKQQFLNFYETKEAAIYDDYEKAMEDYRRQQAIQTVEKDDIILLRYVEDDASLASMLKQMFRYIADAVTAGKKRFIMSFVEYYEFDKMDLATIKLVIGNFLRYRSKGVDIRFVVPSSKVKSWFSEVSEGVNVEFYQNEAEAFELFKRDCFYSIAEKERATVLTINQQFGQNRMWGVLKSAFRNIFEFENASEKKFILDLSKLTGLDAKSLKLVEGAMTMANGEGRDLRIVTSSETIIDQFGTLPGTRDLVLYPSVDKACGG